MKPASHEPPACLTLAFDGSVATLRLHHGPMNAIDDVLLNDWNPHLTPLPQIRRSRCSA